MRTFTLVLCGFVFGWNVMTARRRLKSDDPRADDNALMAILAAVAIVAII